MSDGPRFLTGAPEPVQPAAPVGGAGPFRQAGAPRASLAAVEKELAEREAQEARLAREAEATREVDVHEQLARAMEKHARRDFLDELLAPHRWPWFIRRYPRLVGLALLLLGADGVRRIVDLTENGGVYMKTLPITTAVGLLIGGWFAIAGRPEDEDGYTPRWWNIAYVAVCLCAIPVGIAIKVTWL